MNNYKKTGVVFAVTILIALSFPGRSRPEPASGDRLTYYPLRTGLLSYRFISEVDDAAAVFVNPAGLGAREIGSSILRGSYEYDRLNEATLGICTPSLGLGYSYVDRAGYQSRALHLGVGAKLTRGLFLGSSLRWHNSDVAKDSAPFTFDIGFMARPSRYLSIAGVWENSNQPGFAGEKLEDSFTGGISIRPLTDRLTLSAQGRFSEEDKPGWQAGGSFQILPGLELFGSYGRENIPLTDETYEEFTAGAAFTFGATTARAATSSRPEANYDYSANSFSLERAFGYRKDALYHRGRFAEITIGGSYVDEGGGFQFMGNGGKDLHSLLRRLRSVREDDDIDGLLLRIKNLKGGFIGPVSASLNEIRESVRRVTESGKPVVAYLVNDGSAAELYLASAADRVVMPDQVTIGMIGVSLEVNRMKRMFEKFGVEWNHTTAGDYKSTFHTQYTDTSTSVQEEELQGLVDEAYRLMVNTIAEGRGIDRARMLELADGRILTNQEAIDYNLVDDIGWEKTARKKLAEISGLKDEGDLDTSEFHGRKYWKREWAPPASVAVVGAYGGIKTGKSGVNPFTGGRTMGSASVVKSLKSAAGYPGVAAIVFRVDSGGGSSLASDEILNEIKRIQREENIPVIVSMSNLAGSGGYWISMSADAIFADPFTITGSIGVVMAKPVIRGLYEKLGVTNEVFKSGKHSDAMSPGRHLTEEEMEMVERHVDIVYRKFVKEVADGRDMKEDEALRLAGGRLYFGTQAREVKLVDRLGGLEDAIEFAALKASVDEDYETVYFPAFDRFFFDKLPFSPAAIGTAIWNLFGKNSDSFDKTAGSGANF